MEPEPVMLRKHKKKNNNKITDTPNKKGLNLIKFSFSLVCIT